MANTGTCERDSCCVGDLHYGRGLFLLDNPLRRLVTRPKKFVSRYLSRRAVAADLGCGPGFYTVPMAETVGPEGKIYAIDSHEKSIKALKSKISKHGYQNIDARVASAAQVGFIPDHSLDFILSNEVLCCMVDHEGAVREMKRLLKHGALAYLSVGRSLGWKRDPRDVSKEEWRQILEGFQVIREKASLTGRWAVVSLREYDS